METAASVRHIPSTFVRALMNIATDRLLFTAESWGFWFVHLAPKLLEGRFAKRKYYTHMCELVEIEATQGQRTQEPTTQVTLRRGGEDRTQAMSKNPKRA